MVKRVRKQYLHLDHVLSIYCYDENPDVRSLQAFVEEKKVKAVTESLE